MSTIPPVGSGQTQPTMLRPTVAGGSPATAPKGPSGTPRGSSVGAAVQGLLQDIGGGVENNQALQLLLTLIILMALLQAGQQSQTAGSGDAMQMLEALAQRGEGAGGSAALYIEQTSISVSTTTIVAAFGQSGEAVAAGDALNLLV